MLNKRVKIERVQLKNKETYVSKRSIRNDPSYAELRFLLLQELVRIQETPC